MARKKKNGLTLDMFKAWLQGVEEMQGPDWTPSPEQWRKIREKLEQIEEEESVVVAAPQTQPAPYFSMPQMPPPQSGFAMPMAPLPNPIDPNNPPPPGTEFV